MADGAFQRFSRHKDRTIVCIRYELTNIYRCWFWFVTKSRVVVSVADADPLKLSYHSCLITKISSKTHNICLEGVCEPLRLSLLQSLLRMLSNMSALPVMYNIRSAALTKQIKYHGFGLRRDFRLTMENRYLRKPK